MTRGRSRKTDAYTSSSLAVSRRMISPGEHFEERAIIHDLMSRFRSLESSLGYYDHATGRSIAAEASKLRAQAWERIERLPVGQLRSNLSREMQR